MSLPPVTYDHAPTIPYGVVEETQERVTRLCEILGGPNAIACTWQTEAGFTVIIPKVGRGGVAQRTHDLILRHERGHVNGWPADHPGAR